MIPAVKIPSPTISTGSNEAPCTALGPPKSNADSPLEHATAGVRVDIDDHYFPAPGVPPKWMLFSLWLPYG